MSGSSRHKVVIVGGGFGGLYAAKALGGADVEVVLVDRRNFHLFQPLLYQVATGGLSPANIAAPLRAVLSRYANVSVLLAEVTGLELASRRVLLADGALDYDTLVLATGSTHHYFGHEAWASRAPGLKTVEDALTVRGKVFYAFEAAERESDPERQAALLTFVVVGGGPTGVEMAGAIAEVARMTLRNDYRNARPEAARIYLVEMAPRVLTTYPESLSERAREDLERLGVQVLTNTSVLDVREDGVLLLRQGVEEMLPARTVVWAAGVRASPLGGALAEQAGVQLDRQGRVHVQSDLSVPGHPEVFVIGDLAHFEQDGQPLLAVAPVAMQQGRFVADEIKRRLEGLPPRRFEFHDRGSMATIGRSAAVADLHFLRLSGQVGWLAWLFIHLMMLAGFENRLLVFVQWAWNYLTRSRSARLITGHPGGERE